MQSVTLIAVGKLNEAYFSAAAAEYQKRLSAMCRFRMVEISEETISEKSASPALIAKALEKEGEAILTAVPKGAALFALCVEGKELSSEALADEIARRALSGSGDIAFVIGSSHGLSPRVKSAAALRLSMGPMTFPHKLARVMLLEQIYRAFSINAGTKYHK